MINLIGISGKAGSGKDTVGTIIQMLTNGETVEQTIFSFNCGMFPLGDDLWEIKKFATKLKEICSLLTGISVEDFEKEEVKSSILGEEWWYYNEWKSPIKVPYKTEFYVGMREKSESIGKVNLIKPTVRELLQKVGTDAMRDVIHPDVWVNALMKDYRAIGFDYKGSLNKEIQGNWQYPSWIISDVRFENECKAIKDRQGIVIRVNRITHNVLIDNDTHTVTDWQHPSETSLDNYKFDYVIENDSDIPSLIEKVKEMLIYFKLL